ncbi:hypothetical protein [Ignatzschineria cameli]|uniref:hypothetical protein n=1 Tax=Ignatzschineria cameli TaxID=2182793 RepID=UPI001057B5B5|nr:hypothetical protein [Ignatzschineria cameli]
MLPYTARRQMAIFSSPIFEVKKAERCRISLSRASIYHAPADGNFSITPKGIALMIFSRHQGCRMAGMHR